MPISPETLDFLTENKMHDNSAWFREHKPEFQRLVTAPMTELVEALAPVMHEIDPLIVCEAKVGKCLSRIYRDTRFSKDKSTFRDVMWLVFTRDRRQKLDLPGFVFEFSPRGFMYGCGFYQAERQTLELIRSRIISGSQLFWDADAAVKNSVFELSGDKYKRARFPEYSPEQREWLERKSVGAWCSSRDYDLLFSPDIAQKLSEDFAQLKPVYELLTVY